MSVVGFDFGYETCYIAVARQGGIETVANEFSDRCTPAVVSMGERQRTIGGAAKQQMVSNLKNTIWGWKKLIGRNYNEPHIQQEKSQLPYELIQQEDGSVGIKVHYLGEQQVFSPQQVSAMIFTKLKHTAEKALNTKMVDVVISVPCYFTDIERRCMLDAAGMAGLNVLRLMNDTTATALAYGIYKQDLPGPDDKPRITVFLDVGHADLQMSAVAFNKAKLKVLATVADSNLGGRDLDRLLADHFAEEFKARYKVDAKTNPKAYVRLLAECGKLKKLMSANATDIPINIECFMNDKDVTGKLNRSTMEAMASDVLERARQAMCRLLQSANLRPDDVYAVEIVGGSSRVPAIKSLVKEIFGMEPSTTLNADEAVARGCALQCAILSPTFRVRDFSIVDAQPYPITLSWQGAMEEDSSMMEVFSFNHQIPFSKMLTFYRRDSFTLHASYTDNIPYPTNDIGSFTVQNVQPQASGESSKVKVKVRVNINGIFNVSTASMVEDLPEGEEVMEVENGPKEETKEATPTPAAAGDEAKPDEKTTEKEADAPMDTDQTEEKKEENDKQDEVKEQKKKKKKVKVIDLPIMAKVVELSKSELNQFLEKEGQMIMQDKLEKERADCKNAVEEYVYEMRDKLYTSLEQFVKESDRDSLSLKLEDTENWLYDEGEDQNKQVYIDKLTELKKFGQPIIDRYREASERPKAFEALGSALQKIRKVIELYHAKDEKYSHLEAKEFEKVEKCVKEKTEWFEKNLNAANKQKLYDCPAVLVSQIRHETQSLSNTCTPIITKPKPKPKEEPPKDTKKDEKQNGETANENPAEGKGEGQQEATASENPSQEQEKSSTADMDLD